LHFASFHQLHITFLTYSTVQLLIASASIRFLSLKWYKKNRGRRKPDTAGTVQPTHVPVCLSACLDSLNRSSPNKATMKSSVNTIR